MATHPNIDQFLGPDIWQTTETGIPLSSVQLLRDAGLTFTEVSDLVISPRTFKHRKSRGEALSQEESDRVVRVARVLNLAEKVFANHDKAMRWLRIPDDRYGERTPLSLLRTESGGRIVEEMLWQIDEGIYT